MNETDWLSSPELANLSSEKKEFIKKIIASSKELNNDNAMSFLVKTNAMIKASGIQFTKEENEIITAILTSKMSEKEKKKYEAIKEIINTRFKKS